MPSAARRDLKLFRPAYMKSVLTEGESGSAKIIQDRPDSLTRLRAAMAGQALSDTFYTRLLINGKVWMTDAEFEWRTNLAALYRMHGDVLIAGLGIGFVVYPLLKSSRIASVTVIENNDDVIALVAPQLKSKKLAVLQADAFTWEPPRKAFNSCYLDVWRNVPNADDWQAIKTLKKKYRRALKRDGWIAAWCEDYARR